VLAFTSAGNIAPGCNPCHQTESIDSALGHPATGFSLVDILGRLLYPSSFLISACHAFASLLAVASHVAPGPSVAPRTGRQITSDSPITLLQPRFHVRRITQLLEAWPLLNSGRIDQSHPIGFPKQSATARARQSGRATSSSLTSRDVFQERLPQTTLAVPEFFW